MKALVLIGWVCLAVVGQADTLVVPSQLANVEGNSGANLGWGFGVPSRIQQVYSSSLFSALGPEGANISELRFRIDGGGPNGFSTTSELEVHLSSTPVGEGSLSWDCRRNVGSDETVVLTRRQINLSSGYVAGGPNAFSIVIPFPTRFHYSPSNGNLLVDIFAYEPGQLRVFDAQFIEGDGLGIVYGGFGPQIEPMITTVFSAGFVTQFTFVTVPEPSIVAFSALGLVSLGLRSHYVKRRTRVDSSN
jgi:hypothetical protein